MRPARRPAGRPAVHGLAALALAAALLAAGPAAAQSSEWDELLDNQYQPEYRAASVVTTLWLAAFAVTSALFGLLGAIVALSWPNPRFLCYRTSFSDMPSNSSRSCCSLYSLNLGFAVFWLLVFAIMVIARDVVRIVVCLCFSVVHVAVVLLFRVKFKRHGRPERPHGAHDVAVGAGVAGGAMGAGGPRQAVGIPVYDIPMQTVVIGAPAGAAGAGAPGAGVVPPGAAGLWYDAACVPPPQQPGMAATQQPAAGAAFGGAPAAYPPQPPYAGGFGAGGFEAPPYPPQPPAAAFGAVPAPGSQAPAAGEAAGAPAATAGGAVTPTAAGEGAAAQTQPARQQ